MTDIKLKTDARGCVTIVLRDEERFGARARGLGVGDIFIQAATGHCFVKSSAAREGLVRLSDVDVEMVEYYLRETGKLINRPLDIFAGDPPPDG